MATNQPTTLDQILARGDWRQQLVTDYEQTARRLQSTYQRSLPLLKTAADAFNARLNGYVDANGGMPTVSHARGWKQYDDLINRVRAEMADFARLLENEARVLQESAIVTGVDGAQEVTLAVSGDARAVVQAAWLRPDPAALERLIGYVDSDAFKTAYSGFGENAAQNLGDALLLGIAQGRNPTATARLLNAWFTLPLAWANNIARTTQLYSYRAANHATYTANQRIIQGWVWIATLDSRVCLCCLSEHGKLHPLSETLNGHHQCRCTPAPYIRGATWLDSYQTGPQWFDEQPPDVQRSLMGHAKHSAYSAGAIGWDNMTEIYSNEIFGDMRRESSLKEILGAGANKYYSYAR